MGEKTLMPSLGTRRHFKACSVKCHVLGGLLSNVVVFQKSALVVFQ